MNSQFKGINPEYIKHLNDIKATMSASRNQTVPESLINKILEQISELYKCSEYSAATALYILLQQGASANTCDGNLTYKENENLIFTLGPIRKIISKEIGKNSMQKIAKTRATHIYTTSKILQIEGNLTKKIKKLFYEENFEQSDIYWMSDFQAYNPDCPAHIRNKILSTFNKTKFTKSKSQRKNK